MQIQLGDVCVCGETLHRRDSDSEWVDANDNLYCTSGETTGGYHFVNEQNLKHLRCPSCRASRRVVVTIPARIEVADSGYSVYSDPILPDWENEPTLAVTCGVCSHQGVAADFLVKQATFSDVTDIDAFLSA